MKKTFKHHDQKTQIEEYLKKHPEANIPDLVRVFSGSFNSINYALKKFGIKIKPRPHARKEDFTAYVSSHPEMSPAHLAKMFHVCEKTIYRHVKKNKIKPTRVYNKFDHKKISRYLASHPDASTSELAKVFKKSYAGMYAMLKLHNITIKNKLCYEGRKKTRPRKKTESE